MSNTERHDSNITMTRADWRGQYSSWPLLLLLPSILLHTIIIIIVT